MAQQSDWLLSTRDEQLALGKNWITILRNPVKTGAGDGGTGQTSDTEAGNVPAEAVRELDVLVSNADIVLSAAKNEKIRTSVATANCEEAFRRMIEKMQDIKNRYFHALPLQDSDLVALGLKISDPVPTARTAIETCLVGRHQLCVKIIYITGNPADPANKGYRIWYTVVPLGKTPPAGPEDLHKSFYTKRKRDIIAFNFSDHGKAAYFAVQIENEGKKGPWGPMVSALIL
jgi:hypothetical protein